MRADFFFSLTMFCCGAIFSSTLAESGVELAQAVERKRSSTQGAYPVSVLCLLLLWQLAVATTLASLDRLGRRGTVAAVPAATAAAADSDSGVGPDADAGVGPGADTAASTVARLFRSFLPSPWRLSVRRVRRARHRWPSCLSWRLSWCLSPVAVRLALRFVPLVALPILALEVIILAVVPTRAFEP